MKGHFIFCLLLLFALPAVGHSRGGQITISKTSGNTCQITLKGFINAKATIIAGGGTLDFGDGATVIVPANPNYVHSYDPLIYIYQFSISHTFPGPGFYNVTYQEHNLDAGFVNLNISVETPLFLESGFRLDPSLNFSSITFSCDPVSNFISGRQFSFSTAPVDTLSSVYNYELVVPNQASEIPVLNYIFPENLQLNSQTGLLTWDTKFNGEYVDGEFFFAVRINQFDLKGNYLSYVIRSFTVAIQNIPSEISIHNPVSDPNGKIKVLPGNQKRIKTILSDAISIDSLVWFPYFDSSLANNIAFTQYDSSTATKKFKVGVLSLSSTNTIVRQLPYSIILRGISFGMKSSVGLENAFAKDVSFLLFTKKVDLPLITIIAPTDKEVAVYPNPCTNELHVSGNINRGGVMIVNNIGQLVAQSTFDKEIKIDTSQLASGIYFVILNVDNQTSRFKVVKK